MSPPGSEIAGVLSNAVQAGIERLVAMPIDIRRSDYALVSRGTLGGAKELLSSLEPGPYLVSVTLPFGTKVGQEIHIGEDRQVDLVKLAERLAELPAVAAFLRDRVSGASVEQLQTWGETLLDKIDGSVPDRLRGFVRSLPAIAGALIDTKQQYEVKLVGFSYEAGQWRPVSARELRLRRRPETAAVSLPSLANGTLQILRTNAAPLNVMLPAGTVLTLAATRMSKYAVDITPSVGIDIIDDLLGRRVGGRLDDIAAMVHTISVDAVGKWARERPAAGLAAAYCIMRTSDRSSAEAAVQMLQTELPNSPDVQILAAELHALQGLHERALPQFITASRAGLPVFSYGLNYLVDRLRFYLQCALSRSQGAVKLNPSDLTAAAEALKSAQSFALFTDFGQPLMTWTGRTPDEPSDEPATDEMVRARLGRLVGLGATARPAGPESQASTGENLSNAGGHAVDSNAGSRVA